MHIDCDTCSVRGAACGGCVVTMLLGAPPEGVVLDDAERTALGVLADQGLVRPLLLATGEPSGPAGTRPDDTHPDGTRSDGAPGGRRPGGRRGRVVDRPARAG